MTGLSILLMCGALSCAATRLVLGLLKRRAILDLPNERSSHSIPTPRGGGWGIMAVVLPSMLAIGAFNGMLAAMLPIVAGTVLLTVVSWIDDRRTLGALPRLAAQIIAVALGLLTLHTPLPGLEMLPGWLVRLGGALSWLWFVNLFNFMDGIDGLAGTEAAAIGLGLALVAGLAGLAAPVATIGLAIAGAALGFLIWNWQPAKLFMGDVGSVPLGYLLGWLLLSVADQGQWPAAMLVPAYFLADATWTLLRRLAAGKRIWQAHREHFYQRAVLAGRSHARVAGAVAAADLALVGLAALSVDWGWRVLPAGLAVTGLLLAWLARRPDCPPTGGTSAAKVADKIAEGARPVVGR